jgi:Lipocalin-like domain
LRAAGCTRFLSGWLICILAPICAAASADCGGTAHVTRQQLIGAWRLMSIEYSDSSGQIADPFYQANSTGLIVYDSSGWISVHISAPHRRAFKVPASRSASATAQDAPLKAAAFETYYAYFGTWSLDETSSVVTHHVESSLIPAETGLHYAQKAAIEGNRLIFTVCTTTRGEQSVRRKIWERVPPVVP